MRKLRYLSQATGYSVPQEVLKMRGRKKKAALKMNTKADKVLIPLTFKQC